MQSLQSHRSHRSQSKSRLNYYQSPFQNNVDKIVNFDDDLLDKETHQKDFNLANKSYALIKVDSPSSLVLSFSQKECSITLDSVSSAKLLRSSRVNKPVTYAATAENRAFHKEQICAEIRQTENTYAINLNTVLEVFVKPLQTLADLPDSLARTFSNVESLANFHKVFCEDLMSPDCSIATHFLKYADYLKMYCNYATGYNDLLKDHTRISNHSKLQKFLTTQKNRGFDLMSFLILPIQRLPRYELLLNALVKTSRPDELCFDELMEAFHKIHSIATYVNDNSYERENSQKLLEVQSRVLGQFQVIVPGRRFVHRWH